VSTFEESIATRVSMSISARARRHRAHPLASPCAARSQRRAGDVGDTGREDVLTPQSRDVLVEAFDVRQAAAKNDDIRIEHVDHAGERARHAVLVASHRVLGDRVTRRGTCGNFTGGNTMSGSAFVIARQAGTG
jgi:hypothetical protein